MEFVTTPPEPLLYAENNHISSQILRGQEVESIRCVPFDPKEYSWKLTPKMMEYVKKTGLQHMAEMTKSKIDHALINALIERWRPETNTFHFVCGETTITLEDISYLYGLPIDGKAVTGSVWSDKSKVSDTCSRLLGVKIDKAAYLRGGQLSLNWILSKFRILPEKITADDEIRYARAYCFFLVASQICTNNSGARGHAYLLELFEEFDRYAWGPACLACVYRSMTRATQITDRLRTITGPMQLLQIWAYSHTAVGRSLRAKLGEACFEFPLFKMWHSVLKDHSFSSTIPERRKELCSNGTDQIEWQPYQKFTQQLRAIVNHRDIRIFRATSPLIYYWIIERHNADRVYKQFGLIQPVPLPFHRWQRMDERASSGTVDYSVRNQIFVDAWDRRETSVIGGMASEIRDSQCEENGTNSRIDLVLQKVDRFLQWQVCSIASITPRQGADVLYHLTKMLGRKIQDFRMAIKSLEALEELDIEGFINIDSSLSNPRMSEKNQKESIGTRASDSPTDTTSSKKSERQQDDNSITVRSRKTTLGSARTPSSSLKRKRKFHLDLSVHGPVQIEKSRIPPLLSPYQADVKKGEPHPSPECILSTDELTLLESFWEIFHTRPDALHDPCSYITATELQQILKMHWISTTVMDYWLAINPGRCEGTYIFPSTLANWRDRGWDQACDEAFVICHSRRMDDYHTLIFPIWYMSHFFLLVALPSDRRWEYYNTMGWRKRHWEYACQFKGFVCIKFEVGGWHGAEKWEMRCAANCPMQGNSNDCRVFVMAISYYLARRRALTLSQADMWYFRRKLVHDMYKEQLVSYEALAGSPDSSEIS